MNKARRTLAAWIVLACSIAAGQDIVISVPNEPLAPGEYAQFLVTGLSDADLPAASIVWEPKAGVVLIPAKTWGNAPFLLFSAKQPGKYTITIVVNSWVANLAFVVMEARAARPDPGLLSSLEAVLKAAQDALPVRKGTATVLVGNQPNPNPDPQPDPQPPPGRRDVAVIYESENNRPGFVQATQLLRSYCQSAGHSFRMVDDDTKDPNGKTPAWLQVYLNQIASQSIALPALIIAADWNGSRWLKAAGFPATGDQAIKYLMEAGG